MILSIREGVGNVLEAKPLISKISKKRFQNVYMGLPFCQKTDAFDRSFYTGLNTHILPVKEEDSYGYQTD
jgi:hypothetical protein